MEYTLTSALAVIGTSKEMVSIQLPYHSDKNQTPFINVFRHCAIW